jgi:2-haloacid dehalogenase
MAPAGSLQVVLFDVVETVFSLEPVRDRLRAHGCDGSLLETFFARLLRDAFALGCCGHYRPFAALADSALAAVAPELSEAARGDVKGAFRRLPAHDDARPAFEALRDAGVRVGALSNGAAEVTTELLESAGLAGLVERVFSVDEVGVWKPRPEPYRHAVDELGVAPEAAALVAVHAWDTHGARQAGLVTGWASRLEGRLSPVFDAPDVVGDDLVEVVVGLLER